MGDGGVVVGLSAEHEDVGSTHGSSIVSSATDVLGMGRVGGVCQMCMCLARSCVGGEGVSG